MCFAHDASPPFLPAERVLAPLAGGAPAEVLELTSADGTRFSAAIAEAPRSAGPAVVILPDVRGLYPFYVELAERFAAAGHHAVAIDYFGRTAGLGLRGEDFDFMPHVLDTRPDLVRADAAAARDLLQERTDVTSVVSVGFCFGGLQSFLASADAGLGLAAAVGFYGALDGTRFGIPSPKDEAVHARCAVLGLFGGADDLIPADQRETFAAGLRQAGVHHEIEVYDGAPHSFFDRHQELHAEASADAWRRTLDFLAGAAAPQPA